MLTNKTEEILIMVRQERMRQRELLKEGKILTDCSDPMTCHESKMTTLVGQIGDAARSANALNWRDNTDQDIKDLRAIMKAELIQVAAVAVAWAESLED